MATTSVPLKRSERKRGILAYIVGAETPLQTREALEGYLFALPWILGLVHRSNLGRAVHHPGKHMDGIVGNS
jgi:hypothetical protein